MKFPANPISDRNDQTEGGTTTSEAADLNNTDLNRNSGIGQNLSYMDLYDTLDAGLNGETVVDDLMETYIYDDFEAIDYLDEEEAYAREAFEAVYGTGVYNECYFAAPEISGQDYDEQDLVYEEDAASWFDSEDDY